MWTLADKYNVMTPFRAAEELVKKLRPFKPFIYRKATSRCSIYIHFNGLPSGLTHKLRVSNHEEPEKYGYKWQLRIDGLQNVQHMKLGRYYYDDIDLLVKAFNRYYEKAHDLENELMAEREVENADN
jgi:hypothetical protein